MLGTLRSDKLVLRNKWIQRKVNKFLEENQTGPADDDGCATGSADNVTGANDAWNDAPDVTTKERHDSRVSAIARHATAFADAFGQDDSEDEDPSTMSESTSDKTSKAKAKAKAKDTFDSSSWLNQASDWN